MHITKEEIDIIKRSADLISVIESRGIRLKKKGKNYVGLCPFHEETTPSFTVDPVKQLWNCFGCPENGKGSTGGDVIGFVVKYDNIGFKEAVEKLKGQASGILQESKGIHHLKSCPQNQEKPDLETLTPKQQKLLNRVMQYYQASLLKDMRGLEYLRKERGIQDKQSMLDFCVGFASGNLFRSNPP